MKKKTGKDFGKSGSGKDRPRAQRLSQDEQSRFRGRRQESDSDATGGESKPAFRERPSFASKRPPKEEKPANVHVYLSPSLMELAEELAHESNMSFKTYVFELLKYALLAHGKRLGKKEKFVAEFKSTNRKTVSGWQPEGEEQEAGSEKREWRRSDSASEFDRSESKREFSDREDSRGKGSFSRPGRPAGGKRFGSKPEGEGAGKERNFSGEGRSFSGKERSFSGKERSFSGKGRPAAGGKRFGSKASSEGSQQEGGFSRARAAGGGKRFGSKPGGEGSQQEGGFSRARAASGGKRFGSKPGGEGSKQEGGFSRGRSAGGGKRFGSKPGGASKSFGRSKPGLGGKPRPRSK